MRTNQKEGRQSRCVAAEGGGGGGEHGSRVLKFLPGAPSGAVSEGSEAAVCQPVGSDPHRPCLPLQRRIVSGTRHGASDANEIMR